MKYFFSQLRNKPDHQRNRLAKIFATGTTLLLFIVFLLVTNTTQHDELDSAHIIDPGFAEYLQHTREYARETIKETKKEINFKEMVNEAPQQ